MPPNALRKLLCFLEVAKRVSAAAKARKISFFSLFLADARSVFGNRQDHDKHEIFVRLSKVRTLAPYLTHTVLFSQSYRSSAFPEKIQFPVVVKPIRGLQSVGVVVIQDRNTLGRFLRKRRGPYVIQRFIQEGVEIGVSYTRNPTGQPDFFGVACKEPVCLSKWRQGVRTVPKHFCHQDVSDVVDRNLFLELCRMVAETLQTNSLRIDAFIQTEGARLRHDTLQIIEVNAGPFTVDQFLLDPKHSREFVVAQLTQKYTYLLQWGDQHSPHPDFSTIRKWLLHFAYCYIVVLLSHAAEIRLVR
jgi:hypothetical protein